MTLPCASLIGLPRLNAKKTPRGNRRNAQHLHFRYWQRRTGRTHEQTPIRSWARYLKIKSGNDNLVLMGNPESVLQRLYAEIEKRE